MLMSIPVISPIELTLGEPSVRRLPPPDYEVQALPPAAVVGIGIPAEDAASTMVGAAPVRDAASVALDDIEHASQISEYHDFSWWDERIRIIRDQLRRNG